MSARAGAAAIRRIPALCCLLLAAGTACAPQPKVAPAEQDDAARHAAEIRDWHERRVERLRSEDGWLTLVGLDWLSAGANTVGGNPGNDIRLPGGPGRWGTVFLEDGGLRFEPAPGAPVTVDGAPAAAVALVADDAGTPTVVRSGNLSFHVILRGSYALRVQDTQAPARVNFAGLDRFGTSLDWRIEARFLPAPAGTMIEIGDVLGQVTPNPVYGYVEFDRNGTTHRLTGLGDADSESLWFIFADRTSGRETYGAGRFVYSDGMPSGERLVVDFNKSYNPPCAFSEYSTCPLPPQENRLDLEVRAGEKDYHAASGLQ